MTNRWCSKKEKLILLSGGRPVITTAFACMATDWDVGTDGERHYTDFWYGSSHCQPAIIPPTHSTWSSTSSFWRIFLVTSLLSTPLIFIERISDTQSMPVNWSSKDKSALGVAVVSKGTSVNSVIFSKGFLFNFDKTPLVNVVCLIWLWNLV